MPILAIHIELVTYMYIISHLWDHFHIQQKTASLKPKCTQILN